MQSEYIRIGSEYYKRIINQDASGWPFNELRAWTRQAILDDFGKDYLKTDVKRYDAFTNVPINGPDAPDIQPNLYNLYTPLLHYPTPGEWPVTEGMLRHVFGEQYELGLDYVQLLLQDPLQMLPILCLVSRENVTGKTTFLNWLRGIFNGNMIVIGNQDIHGRFNSHYAHKLIIAVDESKIDKEASLEKLKALSTQKTINYEGKFQNAYTIPFFGKFILCSNYEDNFINAKDEDVRYWVRKLSIPKELNVNIEDDLETEIPAFLFDIQHRSLSTNKQSRAWFAYADIETEALLAIKYQSKSWLYRDLDELVINHFLTYPNMTDFMADPTDIRDRWFAHKNNAELSFIRKTLKNEFKLESDQPTRYTPFGTNDYPQKVGRAFTFKRDDFITADMVVRTVELPGKDIKQDKDDDDLPF